MPEKIFKVNIQGIELHLKREEVILTITKLFSFLNDVCLFDFQKSLYKDLYEGEENV